MTETNGFDAATFLDGLASYKETAGNKRPIRSVLVDFLRQTKIRKEVESALASGFSRKALVSVLSEQRKVSMPTLRRALDEVFPRKGGGKSAAKPLVNTAPAALLERESRQSTVTPLIDHAGFAEDPT